MFVCCSPNLISLYGFQNKTISMRKHNQNLWLGKPKNCLVFWDVDTRGFYCQFLAKQSANETASSKETKKAIEHLDFVFSQISLLCTKVLSVFSLSSVISPSVHPSLCMTSLTIENGRLGGM